MWNSVICSPLLVQHGISLAGWPNDGFAMRLFTREHGALKSCQKAININV